MCESNILVPPSQATVSHVCNPINHKCSCERGFTPTVNGELGLGCTRVKEVSQHNYPLILPPTIPRLQLWLEYTTYHSKYRQYTQYSLYSPVQFRTEQYASTVQTHLSTGQPQYRDSVPSTHLGTHTGTHHGLCCGRAGHRALPQDTQGEEGLTGKTPQIYRFSSILVFIFSSKFDIYMLMKKVCIPTIFISHD